MTKYACNFCGTLNESMYYCGWDCSVKEAKQLGYKEILPNNLPVRCIKQGVMLECEHGDHQDYKFPVRVNNTNTDDPEELSYEIHALIYEDGFIAVTLYECCYFSWYLRDGSPHGGKCSKYLVLSPESIQKIKQNHLDEPERIYQE